MKQPNIIMSTNNALGNQINLIGSRNVPHFTRNRYVNQQAARNRNANTSRVIKVAPVRRFKKLTALVPIANAPRGTITRQPTMAELTGWTERKEDRKLEIKTAITCCCFVKDIMQDTEGITCLDLYGDLKTIEDWTQKGLEGLFLANKATVLLTIGWSLRFRNCVAHKWLKRIIKYRHQHLSAIYHLAGDGIINEPNTRKEALDRLTKLGLTPLALLPPL